MTVLAIDQGTSGTKAVVVDAAGTPSAVCEEPLRPAYLGGGAVEQDPRALLDSVLVAGRRALETSGRRVEAVALANQGETVLAWDPATGDPLTPAIVWQDRRAESVCAGLADAAGLVAARTGLTLDAYFTAPKLAWLRRTLTTQGVVTTTDTWLLHHLTGAFVTDVTTASRSLLLDVDQRTWDPELTGLFGLDGERLPRVVGCDEVVGTTTAFGAEMPVTGVVVDQQAALLAQRCLDPGSAKCTYGTGAFLLANVGPTATRSTAGLATSVAWQVRGGADVADVAYCLDGQVFTAASAIRWLVDLGLVGSAADLDAVAAQDAGDVLCVPALAGLGAPWWRADAQGALTGLTLSTGRGEVVLAVLQGIAAQVATLAGSVAADLRRPLTRLRVDGGLTRSRVLMQAQADLLGVPVDVYPSPHATGLGAAALARVGLDPGLALVDAVDAWTPAHTYEPRWTPDRAAAHLTRWNAAVATAPARSGGTS
ncbi:MAG: FGGY family carbohydrate kinase [Kineosporiaceae bacterium]